MSCWRISRSRPRNWSRGDCGAVSGSLFIFQVQLQLHGQDSIDCSADHRVELAPRLGVAIGASAGRPSESEWIDRIEDLCHPHLKVMAAG